MPTLGKSANPLFAGWVKELYDKAKENDTKGVFSYRKAYDALRNCPDYIAHPAEAIKLDGVGGKTVEFLTKKLMEHCQENNLPMPENPREKNQKRKNEDNEDDISGSKPKKPCVAKPYNPTYKSGSYAIIIALSSVPEDSLESMSKEEIIGQAQEHCSASFSVPTHANKHYTAWASMKNLLSKELVQERGRQVRQYLLTEEGWEVAKRIRAVQAGSKKSIEGVSSRRVVSHSLDSGTGKSLRPCDLAPSKHKDQTSSSKRSHTFPSLATSSKNTEDSEFFSLLSSSPALPTKSGLSSAPAVTDDPYDFTIPKFRAADERPAMRGTETVGRGFKRFTRPVTLPPGSFTIHPLLDKREIQGKEHRAYIGDTMTTRGCRMESRVLPLGDIFWVARVHDEELIRALDLDKDAKFGAEIALDYIVERKRLDDLVSSIFDGRFLEQKFRLRRSGVRNVIYLIENISLGSREDAQRHHERVLSAIASTQVIDGFFVKRTGKLDESIDYLIALTRTIQQFYVSKSITVYPVTDGDEEANSTTETSRIDTSVPHRYLRRVDFDRLAAKNESSTVRDTFLKMLMCTRGVGAEKALAIQRQWTTPAAFISAFQAAEDVDGMVERGLVGLVGPAKIKGQTSVKIANVWGKAYRQGDLDSLLGLLPEHTNAKS